MFANLCLFFALMSVDDFARRFESAFASWAKSCHRICAPLVAVCALFGSRVFGLDFVCKLQRMKRRRSSGPIVLADLEDDVVSRTTFRKGPSTLKDLYNWPDCRSLAQLGQI